ncbi:prepilin-type N-terminal cleavage/methylation domain-containing protein [Candidatus Uhrbacteria bacterium]|nr:prepilin-type N-terminal cleavage/methylation domain-containing protein [Candidatus Uhrbacteria bacterium]
MGAQKNNQGQSLIEVVIVMALFAILSGGVVSTLLGSAHATKKGAEYIVATGYIKEGIEAARSIRDREYSELTNGAHGLATGSGYYTFSGSSETIDTVYTRTITVEDVYRTGALTGDIAVSGILDNNTKKVTVNVTWDVLAGRTQNIDAVFYVTNWNVQSWTQTTTADFNAGTQNSTAITTTSNGEFQLAGVSSGWSGLQELYVVDLDGNGDRVAAQYDELNDILYIVATSTTGYEFSALDVSSVTESMPTVLGGIDLFGMTISDFIVHDGYAYITSNENSNEVVVVDVATMTQVNSIDLSGNGNATAIDATGTTLIITREFSADDELYFYDISTPTGTLTELGSTSIVGGLTDVAVSSTYAFATSDENSTELFVVRISDYMQVNTVDMSGDGDAMAVKLFGNNLYVGRDDGTGADFHLYDVTSPEGSITETSSLDTASNITDVAISSNEDYAFLATENNSKELVVVDIDTFTELASGDVTGNDNGLSVEPFGAFIYLGTANNSNDFVIFATDTTSWLTPASIGTANKSGTHDVNAIYVDGNYTYLVTENAAGDDELFIYDTTTPSTPSYLGAFEVGDDVNDIVVSGNYAYLATDNNSRELDIIDVTTKTSPSRSSGYNAPGNDDGNSVEISGTTVYLGREKSNKDELFVIDVSSPGSPSLSGSMDTDGDLTDLVIDGTDLYAATTGNSKELNVFDVTTPASPSELGSYDLSGNTDAISVAMSGDVLVIGRKGAGSTSELAVFDVSTASSPTLSGEGEVGSAVNDLSMTATDFVYFASDENTKELQRWNISTPATPVEYSSFDLGADANGAVYNGTYAYMGTEHDSLELQIVGPTTTTGSYATEGRLTSQAFDSGSAVSWTSIEWSESGTGTVEFMIRTASTEVGLSSATWVGSDGTDLTRYSTSGTGITTDPGASGTQWVQWKAFLSGSGTATPIVLDVTLKYSP